ncbi:SidA/IucD/PvdA family monooxygenase [Neisseriaceae bacterium PsAf]|nr:SidA/IucD/PvdA family monooxygenase [Neisseriaceae bacterium PsAf]
MQNNNIYDFIGVGVGPFNLGLACLTEPIKELNGIFLDQIQEFSWHPGLLIEDATLQIPILADLVTLADPTSPYSFLNYLKEKGDIYRFYIKENLTILRSEYSDYCDWALQKLSTIRLEHRVDEIIYQKNEDCYQVSGQNLKNKQPFKFLTKKLILGTGTQPNMPDFIKQDSDNIQHSAYYLNYKDDFINKKSITIIGSGQSAAEIFYDLLMEIDQHEYALNWITRSPRFYPLEYSKLTLEMTSPDYVDYFFSLPAEKKDTLIQKQDNLYKGINRTLINDIFDLLYRKNLNHSLPVKIITNSALTDVSNLSENLFKLNFQHQELEQNFEVNSEAVILATGYSYHLPKFIEPLRQHLLWDKKDRLDVQRNYSVDQKKNSVFIQNIGLYSHGIATPDLGMSAYRNSYIIREITGKDYYPIEKRIAFQNFFPNEAFK